MSYVEWESGNRRARVRLYSERQVQRFDKMVGSLDGRYENAMLVYHDRQSGDRRIIIAESLTATEDERYVYFIPSGRTVETTKLPSYTYADRIRRKYNQERGVRVSIHD